MNNQGELFYGKYRGVVTDNSDPLMLGRLKARVPDIYGGDEESGWAMPSLPYAGKGVGLFLVPPPNASVWIEFEHGEPDYPVWTGCFWTSGEVPSTPEMPEKKVLKAEAGTITLDDTEGAGGITLETTAGMKIVMNSEGIELDNGQGARIKLSGPTVSINDTALEVT